MANYVGVGRSNAFRVLGSEEFLTWLESVPDVRAVQQAEDTYVLLCESDQGGWPSIRFAGGDGEDEEFDIFAELSEHLAEGEVAVLEEVGREKLRVLVGYAVAVNHLGQTVSVNIDEVYDRAAEKWGYSAIARAAS